MLKSVDEIEQEYDVIGDSKDLPSEEMPGSWFTRGLTWLFKEPSVYLAKTVGGCATAVVVAREAGPTVVKYMLPNALPGSIQASTATAAVGVISYAVGNKVTETVSSLAWDQACSVTDTAIYYIFGKKQSAIELGHPSISKLHI